MSASIRWAAPAAIVCLAACAALSVRAQEQGTVDTRAGVAQRIRELEMQVGGDEPPEKQAVVLRWLADLYVSVGRLNDAERAYRQILIFFPFDAGTSNAYARFLLDVRRDPERADRILHDALSFASAQPAPPPYIGETYALRARSLRTLGRCDEAIAPSERALEMLDENAAEEALRNKAACLAETGDRDGARRTYLLLIGVNGASHGDDINAYIAVLASAKGSTDARAVKTSIARAIADARAARRKAAAAERAEILELRAADGVRIEATLRPGASRRAVVFVPETGSRRSAFTPYAQLLSLEGFTTLTIDPRGYGDSRCDSLPDAAALPEEHRARIADDIAAAVRRLVEIDRIPIDSVAVVSAGDGAAFVERAIHEHALPVAVVHVSPIFPPDDRALAAALSFRPPRPALLLAGREDMYAVRSLGFFRDTAGLEGVTTRVLDTGAGHGVFMLREPEHFALVRSWIGTALRAGD